MLLFGDGAHTSINLSSSPWAAQTEARESSCFIGVEQGSFYPVCSLLSKHFFPR